MDVPPKSCTEILDSTIHTVRDCATALRNVVDDNFSPGSSVRSEREKLVLSEIERIASLLENVIVQADGAVRVREVTNSLEEQDLFTNDEKVSPNDKIPFDYDPEVDGPGYLTKWEHLEEEGVEYYDSDDSGGKLYRPRN